MGQEIQSTHFTEEDFAAFSRRVARETEILAGWLNDGTLAQSGGVGGFELEAWLVDAAGYPAPRNEAFIGRADSPLVVPELATFNVEINASPHRLTDAMLTRMHAELEATWRTLPQAGRMTWMSAWRA